MNLRHHQEAIVRLVDKFENGGSLDLQAITDHANASLAILDRAHRDVDLVEHGGGWENTEFRLVLDPEEAS